MVPKNYMCPKKVIRIQLHMPIVSNNLCITQNLPSYQINLEQINIQSIESGSLLETVLTLDTSINLQYKIGKISQ